MFPTDMQHRTEQTTIAQINADSYRALEGLPKPAPFNIIDYSNELQRLPKPAPVNIFDWVLNANVAEQANELQRLAKPAPLNMSERRSASEIQ